ncbi:MULTISPECIES: ABC transporter ATP-binding protein [unclassified Methylophaga]|uniref:ABC transporter ATP-binding protein n=1 Tax=unclassified Methylophaga TaxID=2629249 RepID=UPI00259CB035|nr:MULTISPECIES: ATP-binding cassette domain-containing protein [unclassified Methylophaga]
MAYKNQYAILSKGLTKQYGQALAVNGLDLSIEPGQFYGLLGPNGAGKSTTIHMLTTMTSASSGQAWIAGLDVSKNAVQTRAAVGLVFQDSALDRMMTVDENLQFAAALYHLNKQQAEQRIAELLSVFGLEKKRHQKLVTLSGGQRRAVDIARGVLHKPQVLFLDEPTIGLDLPNRRAIWRFIEQLRKDEGMTVFLTTHYLEEAEACDHVDFIQKGQLQKGGSPKKLIKNLAAYMLEIDCADTEAVSQQMRSEFGEPLWEDQHLTYRIQDKETDFYQLQKTLGHAVNAMQWRKPNLNDVYLWTVCPPDYGVVT